MKGVSHEDLRTQRIHFLRTELQLGHTFAHIAMQKGSSPQKKRRNIENARKAYDAVIAHLESTSMTAEEAQELGGMISTLKKDLVTLGEQV
jgi:hypothetical protein